MNDDEFNDDLLDIDSDSEDTIDTLYEDEDYLDEPSFGEEEHNAAKDEKGHYDRKYYANRQKELDEEVNKADSERHLDDKLNKNYHEGDDPQNKYVNKNAYDKAKDNINYAKAKKNQINNKIADAKNKAYMATHPGELAKEKALEAGDKLKNKVKNKLGIPSDPKEAVKKAAVSIGKKIGQFFLTPQGLLIISIFAFLIFIILIILLFFGDGGSSKNKRIGLYGYDYYDSEYNCTNVKHNGKDMTIDDYAAHVIAGEVSYYPDETLKVFAIAARSFALVSGKKHMESDGSCYIDTTGILQAYSEEVNDRHIKAAEETRGLIITIDNIPKGDYSEACVYTANQARGIDPNGNYSDAYYYIKYNEGKSLTDNIQFQPVEYDKAIGINPLINDINDAINGFPCQGNHARGMSQSGSWYLEKNEGYTWEEIIDYYFQGKEEIKSLYHTYEVSSNWTEVINAGASSSLPAEKLNIPLRRLLSRSEYEDLNDLIIEAVVDAGVGTRDAVVATAVTLIKYLAENHGVVIPYTIGGNHGNYITDSSGTNLDKSPESYYGINPNWGTPISYRGYSNFGPDCSGWTTWVFRNAGLRFSGFSTSSTTDWQTSPHNMDGSFVGSPGDIMLYKNPEPGKYGHARVIVGVDTESEYYYVSESSGSVGINRVSFYDNRYKIYDMSEYYETHKIENFEEVYRNGLIGY